MNQEKQSRGLARVVRIEVMDSLDQYTCLMYAGACHTSVTVPQRETTSSPSAYIYTASVPLAIPPYQHVFMYVVYLVYLCIDVIVIKDEVTPQ